MVNTVEKPEIERMSYNGDYECYCSNHCWPFGVARIRFPITNFKYFLTGKVQTDMLEDRFGKFRQLAGGQYNISLRQLYEVEYKMRLQSSLPKKFSLEVFGRY